MVESFPTDLIDAQRRLHQARAEYAVLCRSLPWSVEPMPGWPGEVHPHAGVVTGGREDSPGYTSEQDAEEESLSALVRELSIEVSTHPYWATLEKDGGLVKARVALKSHPGAWRPSSRLRTSAIRGRWSGALAAGGLLRRGLLGGRLPRGRLLGRGLLPRLRHLVDGGRLAGLATSLLGLRDGFLKWRP